MLCKPSWCSLGHSPLRRGASSGKDAKSNTGHLLGFCAEPVLEEGSHASAGAARTIWQWLACHYSLCRFILARTDASARDRSSGELASSCLGTSPASSTINTDAKKTNLGFLLQYCLFYMFLLYRNSQFILENVFQASCS